MIKKIIIFGFFLSLSVSCEKDFGIEDEREVIAEKDVIINTIPFNYSGDCYPFVYNKSPYLVTDDSRVYKVDELNNSIDFIADMNLSYDPIGAMQEINGSLYFATERYIYKVNNSSFSSVNIVYYPSSSYGEIISFSVIDDIAFVCHKNGLVYSNSNAFTSYSDFIGYNYGARVIKTDGNYYMYSESKIYGSSTASVWNSLITANDLVILSGKNSLYAQNSKITGVISDGSDKLLVSYIYQDSIYTDLLNKSFTKSVNLTASATQVIKTSYSNSFVMGESFLLDGGVFFNFEYQLRSSYSSSYTYPSYSFYSNGSSTSASLNITSKGVRGVINDDLEGCIAPMKLNNKIYTFNKISKEVVVVSE